MIFAYHEREVVTLLLRSDGLSSDRRSIRRLRGNNEFVNFMRNDIIANIENIKKKYVVIIAIIV